MSDNLEIHTEKLIIRVYCSECGTAINAYPQYNTHAEILSIDVDPCEKCMGKLLDQHDREIDKLERQVTNLSEDIKDLTSEYTTAIDEYEDKINKMELLYHALSL